MGWPDVISDENYARAKLHEYVAERIRLTSVDYFSDAALGTMGAELDSFLDKTVKAVGLRLRAYVYAMPKETIEIHLKYPEGWWQALRERWLPSWWLKRWPIVYVRVDITEKRYGPVCPHLAGVRNDEHLQWMAEEKLPPRRAG